MSYFHNAFENHFAWAVYMMRGKNPPQLYCVPWEGALPMISMGERARSENQWKKGFKNVLLSASEQTCL